MNAFVKIVQSPAILDSSDATQFHQEIESSIEAGVKILLLDLKNVTFISNSGLMTLISIFRSVRAAGCKLLIKSSSEQVKILLELTGLDRVFEFLPDLNSPVEDFKEVLAVSGLNK